ncbi:hypothetical protein ACFQ6C_26050 [Streptomyces sp. NPDC056454]|uniref:hypothetical protein n=1 Tax=Streptomyces sp. NPDC056454 TaxID=3345823 RepID=UPI0036CB42CA
MLKFATAQIIAAEYGDQHRLTKGAHRAAFTYEARPGYLYVRSRAISSRTNDNHDEFPAAEIAAAYRTFIGKPVFVNHVNENHRRSRGVIIDAALHEDKNPDGTPDTWAEVLMEVDAKNFPKLARAIIKGEVDRTSMGCDVERSVCSACGNVATTPAEYCAHIPGLKGKRIFRHTASGKRLGELVRETCYGLRFFENSILVEAPADPTAHFLGVDASGIGKAATINPVDFDHDEPEKDDDEEEGERAPELATPPATERPAQHRVPHDGTPNDHPRREDVVKNSRPFTPLKPSLNALQTEAAVNSSERVVDPLMVNADGSISAVAYGEIKAPQDVDTLREENCPVCGDADTYDGLACQVCGFISPPEQFRDPDLSKAKNMDLRKQVVDPTLIDDNGELQRTDENGQPIPGQDPGAEQQDGEEDDQLVSPDQLDENGLTPSPYGDQALDGTQHGPAMSDQNGDGMIQPDEIDPDGNANVQNNDLVDPEMGGQAAPRALPYGAQDHTGDPFTRGPDMPYKPGGPDGPDGLSDEDKGTGAPVPGTPGDNFPDLFCPGCGFGADATPPQTQNMANPGAAADGIVAGDVCPSCRRNQLLTPGEINSNYSQTPAVERPAWSSQGV